MVHRGELGVICCLWECSPAPRLSRVALLGVPYESAGLLGNETLGFDRQVGRDLIVARPIVGEVV